MTHTRREALALIGTAGGAGAAAAVLGAGGAIATAVALKPRPDRLPAVRHNDMLTAEALNALIDRVNHLTETP